MAAGPPISAGSAADGAQDLYAGRRDRRPSPSLCRAARIFAGTLVRAGCGYAWKGGFVEATKHFRSKGQPLAKLLGETVVDGAPEIPARIGWQAAGARAIPGYSLTARYPDIRVRNRWSTGARDDRQPAGWRHPPRFRAPRDRADVDGCARRGGGSRVTSSAGTIEARQAGTDAPSRRGVSSCATCPHLARRDPMNAPRMLLECGTGSADRSAETRPGLPLESLPRSQ